MIKDEDDSEEAETQMKATEEKMEKLQVSQLQPADYSVKEPKAQSGQQRSKDEVDRMIKNLELCMGNCVWDTNANGYRCSLASQIEQLKLERKALKQSKA